MYRGGDELKVKLQQLREGMGYYDSKSSAGNNSALDKSNISANNSILLPELKSITHQIANVKQNALSNSINRKKSIEKVYAPQLAAARESQESSPHGGNAAPYQIYKHANGKIELRSINNNNQQT